MYGIISRRSAANILGVAAITVSLAGCDSDAASTSVPKVSALPGAAQDWRPGGQDVLRYQRDSARGRLWALTSEGVELYDATTRRRVARIALPGWLWVGEPYGSPPDLAIGPRGEVVISSNVVPTLWRIDPVTLAASRHELALDEDKGRDVGFTALAYSSQQGAYLAVSAAHGSLWRIDPRLERAQNIPLSAPLSSAWELNIPARARDQRGGRLVSFCVRGGQGDWAVRLAPDQRSGYVTAGQCVA